MWSVIQLMTHFTGNNFFGAITNIPAMPEALQLAPIMMLVQSLEEMRWPGPATSPQQTGSPAAAVVELLLLWWTLPWQLETAHNWPLMISQSEDRIVSAGPMRDELLFDGMRWWSHVTVTDGEGLGQELGGFWDWREVSLRIACHHQ